MPRRKRYLDDAAPADNTARIGYNPVMRVKQQDTPARRQEEQYKAKVRAEQARVTPVDQRQVSIGPYREKTSLDRAGGRLYAASEQRRKDAKAREEAGVVLGALLNPVMPHSGVDIVSAIKNGEVNSLTDVLAAPYLSDSWSQKNPGKALALDLLTPFAAKDISRGYKLMKAGLKNPRIGIIPDTNVASGFRYTPEELNEINGSRRALVDVILRNNSTTTPATAVTQYGTPMSSLGSQATSHYVNWLQNRGLNVFNATDADIQRYLSEYTQHGVGPGYSISGFTGNAGANTGSSAASAIGNTAATTSSSNNILSVEDAEKQLEKLYKEYSGSRADINDVNPLIDYLRNNKQGFDTNAEKQFFYNLGQKYGVNPMPRGTDASVISSEGMAASRVPILKEARRRKDVIQQGIASGMSKAEAEAAERATRQNIYWGNRRNEIIDFNKGLLSRAEYDALPPYVKVDGRTDYDGYMQLYNTLDDVGEDTMTSTYVRNDFGSPGALTGLDIGRFIEEAPHGERINIHSLSTDSYPAILRNLIKYGDKGRSGIKIQQHPTFTHFNGLGRRHWNNEYITTYDDIKALTDQVNAIYGTSIPYPVTRNGKLYERPEFTIFKYKYGGRVPVRRKYSLR